MTVSENYIFFSSEFIEFVICIYVLPWFKYLVTSERQTTVVAFYGWNQVKKKLFLLKSLKNSNKYLFQKKELKNKSFWKFYNNYWINFAYNALDPNLISCILTNYKVNLWIFIFLVWCFFFNFYPWSKFSHVEKNLQLQVILNSLAYYQLYCFFKKKFQLSWT